MKRLLALALLALPAWGQINVTTAPCSMTDGSCSSTSSAVPATCTTAGMVPLFLGSPLALGCDSGLTYNAATDTLTVGRIVSPGRDIRLLFIGDSHAAGSLHGAIVAGSELSGIIAALGPKDRDWNGTADNAYFRANNASNVIAGTTDTSATDIVTKASFTIYVPQILRRTWPHYLGIIRLANMAIHGSSTYSWSGQQARGYIQVNSLPNAGDTVTVDGVVYTFAASASAAFEVTIGGTVTATAMNLANAINAEAAGWGAGTTRHTTAFVATTPASGLFAIWAVQTGTAGNSMTMSASAGGRVTIYQQFADGSATSALWANAKTRLPIGYGTPDVIVICLGSNDAARAGWRGRGTQAEYQKLLDTIATDYPLAKVIVWRPPVYASQASMASTVLPAIDSVIAANPAVYSVDIYGLGAGSGDTAIVSNDGVHLSHYGYSLAAEIIAAKIADVLGFP